MLDTTQIYIWHKIYNIHTFVIDTPQIPIGNQVYKIHMFARDNEILQWHFIRFTFCAIYNAYSPKTNYVYKSNFVFDTAQIHHKCEIYKFNILCLTQRKFTLYAKSIKRTFCASRNADSRWTHNL